ncbi:hypothetical protein ACFWBC_09605 [Streptomyces sp. NPDC059985]|uniref:hypothetical protein n=1 Tax=Streptomyces sp. NPDC059985 TaxID=3347025 RepID=UPI0036B943B5
MTEADIALARGLELKPWRRREGDTFRARLTVVNPGDRLRLYEWAQVVAYLAGKPLPAPRRPASTPRTC